MADSPQINGWNGQRLDELSTDFREFKREVKADFKEIKETLDLMNSAERAELMRRADRPRQLLYAVAGPVIATIFTLVVTGHGL